MSDAPINATPRLAHAFDLALQLGPEIEVGLLATGGRRRHVPIGGGRIDGDRLHGAVVAGHGGLLLLDRSDQVCVATLSCGVRTDDNCVLWLTGQGYRTASADGLGETVVTLVFEADESSPYAWIARTAFVACGDASQPGVFNVAAIL